MSAQDRLEFFDALVRTQIAVWNAADAAVTAASGLALGSVTALRVIDERGGTARVQDVAETVVITVGAASKVVDRLEREGCVRRVPHPDDRRSSRLEVTPDGARTLAVARAALDGALEAATAGVPAAHLKQARAVLARIRRGD